MLIENYRVILGKQGIQGIILVSLLRLTRYNLSILTEESKNLKVK